jgi:hypothetical protein
MEIQSGQQFQSQQDDLHLLPEARTQARRMQEKNQRQPTVLGLQW